MKHLPIFILTVFFVVCSCSEANNAEYVAAMDLLGPPLTPDDDENATDAPGFLQECQSHVDSLAAVSGYDIQHGIVYLSPEWGLVWRTDFRFEGQNMEVPLVNRIVCWQDDKNGQFEVNIAFGQKIERLGELR